MVEYYNLTKFSEGSGLISFWKTINILSNNIFIYMMISFIFLIPLFITIKNGDDPTKSIHYSALFASLLSLFFYVGDILTNSFIIYICILVYVVTAGIRWYNKD